MSSTAITGCGEGVIAGPRLPKGNCGISGDPLLPTAAPASGFRGAHVRPRAEGRLRIVPGAAEAADSGTIGAAASSAARRCWSAARAAASAIVASRSRNDSTSGFADGAEPREAGPPATASNSLAVPSVTPRRTFRLDNRPPFMTHTRPEVFPPPRWGRTGRLWCWPPRSTAGTLGPSCAFARRRADPGPRPAAPGPPAPPAARRSRMRAKNSWALFRGHLLHPLHHALPALGVGASAAAEAAGWAEAPPAAAAGAWPKPLPGPPPGAPLAGAVADVGAARPRRAAACSGSAPAGPSGPPAARAAPAGRAPRTWLASAGSAARSSGCESRSRAAPLPR